MNNREGRPSHPVIEPSVTGVYTFIYDIRTLNMVVFFFFFERRSQHYFRFSQQMGLSGRLMVD